MSNNGARIVSMTKENLKHMNYIKELEDMNLALTNENEELESKIAKWNKMQNDGYVWVAINPDTNLITNAGTVLPYSRFTFTQEVDKVIDTALYKKIPFYELDSNGKMIKNLQKYNTYKSV